MKVDHEKIIADYMAASRAAHGERDDFSIRYENGWFILRTGRIWPAEHRYRATAIAEMTGRLLGCAAEKEQPK